VKISQGKDWDIDPPGDRHQRTWGEKTEWGTPDRGMGYCESWTLNFFAENSKDSMDYGKLRLRRGKKQGVEQGYGRFLTKREEKLLWGPQNKLQICAGVANAGGE